MKGLLSLITIVTLVILPTVEAKFVLRARGLAKHDSMAKPSLKWRNVLKVRGGDDSMPPPMKDVLSKENVAAFFAVNGLLLGVGWQLATPLMMKVLHGYEPGTPETPENKVTRFAGANMLAYGGLAYLTVLQKMPSTKAMGWSLVPIILNLVVREVIQETTKSDKYKKQASVVSALLTLSAYSLVAGSGPLSADVAAMIPVAILGVIGTLSALFPDDWMHRLEFVDKFEANNHKMRFVTQASCGVHTLCYLAQFVALWKGQDAYRAVGYSALVTAPLGLIFCILLPDMRKSGAIMAPMIPFIALYAFMAWKLGVVPI